MEDPITERATYNFTVKVYPSGQLYIACDPVDGKLAVAGDGGCLASTSPKVSRRKRPRPSQGF
jgi:hypothetical protein